MQANFPGVEFLGTALKFREKKNIRRRLFTSSIVVMHVVKAKKCKKNHDTGEKRFVLLNKPIALFDVLVAAAVVISE